MGIYLSLDDVPVSTTDLAVSRFETVREEVIRNSPDFGFTRIPFAAGPGSTGMRKIQTALALGVAGVLLTACAGASGSTDTGAEGAPTVTVTSPTDGDTVNQPFTLTFTASVPIGPPDSGLNHVHVFTDGNTDDYTVVTTPTFTIKDLPAGRHTVGVTLQHADHSPAGASDEITVQVAGAPIGTPQETGGGGYGGGY